MKMEHLATEIIRILVTEPPVKELAELAGSKEGNIRAIKSKNSKGYQGYVARYKLEKIDELVHGSKSE